MEKLETFETLKKARGLGLKRTIMIAILLLTVILSTALDYISADFDASIYQETAYWVKLVTTNVAVVMALFAMRGYAKETELVKNEELQRVKEEITEEHQNLARNNCLSDFERYVNAENRRRKLAAYTGRLQRRAAHCKSNKRRAKLLELLDHADEQIDYLRVKYKRVRISTLFATSDLRPADDTDFESREGADISRILVNKVISIIAIGILGASIIPDVVDGVNYTMIIGTVIRLFQLAYAVFVGISDGQAYMRSVLLPKSRLRLDFIRSYVEGQKREGMRFDVHMPVITISPVPVTIAEDKEPSSALERLKKAE